jgi:putative salt-induced outer membrane protein YdiY
MSGNRFTLLLGLTIVCCTSAARADVVTTTDGSRLVGTVQKITPAQVELKTSYAGVLTVAMTEVTSLATDAPITTRLTDETTVTGVTTVAADKSIQISSATQQTTATLDTLKAAWLPDATPPPESGYDPRHWVYSLGADFSGKRGNTDQSANRFVGDLALVTRLDELRMYTSYEHDETDNDETADETIVGASYNAYFADPWGWYVRSELERDSFEDIDLRATVAGGLSWRPVNTPTQMLKFYSGVGYRHESYETDIEDNNSTTLDFGMNHRWIVSPWLTLLNDLSYTPAVDDFGNYLFVQDSSLEMPVGTGRRWLVRIGVRNDYNSEPAPDRDELDTAYYTRILVRFE